MKYTLINCECCYSKTDMDWFKDMLASAYRIVTRATKAAENLKKARDKGVRGDTMGFADGSDERRVLKNFRWAEVKAGHTATRLINTVATNLSKMKTHIDDNGWTIRCYLEKDGPDGKHYPLESKFYINCCKKGNYSSDATALVSTLLNELSHLAAGMAGSPKIGPV